MMSSHITLDESAILSRVIAPDPRVMPVPVAKELLRWGFSESDYHRMSELAEKARAATLSEAEQAEIDGFERVSSFLGLVKSKARQAIQAHQGT